MLVETVKNGAVRRSDSGQDVGGRDSGVQHDQSERFTLQFLAIGAQVEMSTLISFAGFPSKEPAMSTTEPLPMGAIWRIGAISSGIREISLAWEASMTTRKLRRSESSRPTRTIFKLPGSPQANPLSGGKLSSRVR